MSDPNMNTGATRTGTGWRGLAPKFLAVLAILTLVAGMLTTMALGLLGEASQRLAAADVSAQRAIAAGRATANLLAFVRGVEYLPMDLTPEQRRQWEGIASDELSRFERRLTELEQGVSTQAGRENLAKLRSALAQYKAIHLKVVDLGRARKFDDGSVAVLAATSLVDEMRKELRAIEERVRTTLHDTVAAAKDEAESARTTMLALAGGGIAVALGLALWIVLRGVTGPLKRLSATAEALAAGQLDAETRGTERRDEVGAIARGLETLRGSALRARELEAEARAAERRSAEETRQGRLALADRVETQLGSVMASLAQSARQLESGIAALSGTAEDATERATSVASAAGQASTNVQTVSSAAEELAASVAEITRQVSQAAQVARQAVEEARAADATVSSLNEAASRIGVVVQLIGDIAGQTNLLALNATIEAARAGDAGKGFAVVASEVKQLAGQTGKATEEISQQITAIQEATERAVQSIRGIAGVVNQVDQIAASIAAAVEEQGAATQEIARSVSEAAIGTDQVSTNIGHVSQCMAATRDALSEMRSTTGEVARQNATLQGEMDTLTRSLRAA